MYIGQLAVCLILLAILVVYIPELVPRCACCRRIKPRYSFRIHKLTGISPGYRGNTSICKKCCRYYNISSIDDFKKLNKIKKKLESKLYCDFK